ncbi:MAG: ribonuclease HII [Anaerolineae bacterium]|nr:ribonuclease HII [Anaerolineae bacterium]MDW8099054.1 ribonuclease HII [Anaerolineae bacterium]
MRGAKEWASLRYEMALWAEGYTRIAGLDEAGRGAWAGPVVAAAVVLPADHMSCVPLLGAVHDSKQLTPEQREQLFLAIREVAAGVGVGIVPASVIDQVGIVLATRQAMEQALRALSRSPDHLLIDALQLPQVPYPQQAVTHGDAISLSIAAASIIAKVTRDHILVELDNRYPGYGFARHKGYGTALHRAALARLGPCPEHRRSFRPIRGWPSEEERR